MKKIFYSFIFLSSFSCAFAAREINEPIKLPEEINVQQKTDEHNNTPYYRFDLGLVRFLAYTNGKEKYLVTGSDHDPEDIEIYEAIERDETEAIKAVSNGNCTTFEQISLTRQYKLNVYQALERRYLEKKFFKWQPNEEVEV